MLPLPPGSHLACSQAGAAVPLAPAPDSCFFVWQLDPPDVDQETPSHASVSWVVDPKPDSKRSLSTKYETTIY